MPGGGDLPDDYGKNPVISIRIRYIRSHMMLIQLKLGN